MLRDKNILPQGKETKTIEPFGEQQNTVLSLLREMYCVHKNIQSQRKYNFVVQQINIDCFFWIGSFLHTYYDRNWNLRNIQEQQLMI